MILVILDWDMMFIYELHKSSKERFHVVIFSVAEISMLEVLYCRCCYIFDTEVFDF